MKKKKEFFPIQRRRKRMKRKKRGCKTLQAVKVKSGLPNPHKPSFAQKKGHSQAVKVKAY